MSGGAMPKQEKVERVAELKERIEGSDALLLTEYRGLSVSEITELRRSLGEGGTKFQVVKNTLMRRAVNDAGVAELEVFLEGPSAVAFVEGDPVAAAKSVVDLAKKYPTLVLKGGFMDGKMLSADDAKVLASLESRDAMLSKIAGLMKSEMTKAAALFVGAQSKFLSLLEAYKEKVPGEEAPEERVAEAEAREPEAEASEPEASETEASDETAEAEASSDGHEEE
jgi:large subunit ribosomal protein L10